MVLRAKGANGEGDAERGELGLGVSERERTRELVGTNPLAGTTNPSAPGVSATSAIPFRLGILLTLPFRLQNPLLFAMPAEVGGMSGVAKPELFDGGALR